MVQLLTGVDIESCEMVLRKGSVIVEYSLGMDLFNAKRVLGQLRDPQLALALQKELSKELRSSGDNVQEALKGKSFSVEIPLPKHNGKPVEVEEEFWDFTTNKIDDDPLEFVGMDVIC